MYAPTALLETLQAKSAFRISKRARFLVELSLIKVAKLKTSRKKAISARDVSGGTQQEPEVLQAERVPNVIERPAFLVSQDKYRKVNMDWTGGLESGLPSGLDFEMEF